MGFSSMKPSCLCCVSFCSFCAKCGISHLFLSLSLLFHSIFLTASKKYLFHSTCFPRTLFDKKRRGKKKECPTSLST
jgi:hypothetical protein